MGKMRQHDRDIEDVMVGGRVHILEGQRGEGGIGLGLQDVAKVGALLDEVPHQAERTSRDEIGAAVRGVVHFTENEGRGVVVNEEM